MDKKTDNVSYPQPKILKLCPILSYAPSYPLYPQTKNTDVERKNTIDVEFAVLGALKINWSRKQ